MRYVGLLLGVVVLSNSIAVFAESVLDKPLPVDHRKPIPDTDAQQQALKHINDLFKDDLATAKTQETKSSLTKKLLQAAHDNTKDDLASQYVLLDMARTLAIQAGDIDMTFQALETLEKIFRIDSVTLTTNSLLALASNPKLELGSRIGPAVEASIADENYALARKLAVAGKMFDRINDIREMEAEYAKVVAANKILVDKPDDPAANLAVGRYHCFIKGKWDIGIQMLAKALSVAPHVKNCVEGEASRPAEAAKQLALADSWWSLADAETGLARKHIRQRAGMWYKEALPNLTSLAKLKAEKRLQELNQLSLRPSGRELSFDLGKGVMMKFVFIPSGIFMMGSPESEQDRNVNEGPRHEVAITNPFYMGVYTVTRGQFAAFVADSGYKTDSEKIGWAFGWNKEGKWEKVYGASWKKPTYAQTEDHPVVCMSYNDAVAFCLWLSKKVGKSVRLPTEAQWEYACRAGSKTRFYFGNDDSQLADYAWYNKNSGGKSQPVGRKKPNAWGLYDMHGNVWQWCSGWYADYSLTIKKTDPQGPTYGESRILRGGGLLCFSQNCRSANRYKTVPCQCADWGFRVVVDAK